MGMQGVRGDGGTKDGGGARSACGGRERYPRDLNPTCKRQESPQGLQREAPWPQENGLDWGKTTDRTVRRGLSPSPQAEDEMGGGGSGH